MRFNAMLMTGAALALAGCGGAGADEANRMTAEGNAIGNELAADSNAAAAATLSGQQYVDAAGANDLYEIEAARLAVEKATRSEVRELAQMIMTDHQRSTTALTAAAREAQPPLNVAPQLKPQQESDLQALRAASGAAFDELYVQQQVRAHDEALRLVTDYAANGDVEGLRRHASSVSGPIQAHLSRARELAVPGAAAETSPNQ